MNIPSIPTDNLYKFMAIFGLVIYAFGAYLYLQSEEKMSEDVNNLEFIKDKIAGDSIILINRIESIKELDALRKVLLDSNMTSTESEEYYRNKRNKLGKERDEFLNDIRNNIVVRKDLQNKFLSRYLSHSAYIRLSKFLSITGIALILIGFTLWYLKYQRYIDAEIKWKGKTFIKLLDDEKAKKKTIQEEFDKVNAQEGNESDTSV